MLVKLQQHRVSKPWGRRDVPAAFGPAGDGEALGEVWFQRQGSDDALLVKYLFTSERLSIQVHPDDAAASKAGLVRGKDEAWIVLDAEPDAEIGIGTTRAVSADELRTAAQDGAIVDLIDWRSAAPGDAYYSPAGTIHAIGPGLTLLEVQQNADVTYRLYDYGRPRELHLDEGVAAAKSELDIQKTDEHRIDEIRSIAVGGGKFLVERWREGSASISISESAPAWLIPLNGSVSADGEILEAPGVWIAESPVLIEVGPGGEILVAYEGAEIRQSS